MIKNSEKNKERELYHGVSVERSGLDQRLILINQEVFDSLINKKEIIDFSNCHFFQVSFDSQELYGFSFQNSRFYNCKFNSGIVSDCNFEKSIFTECDFNFCSIDRCNFKNAGIHHTHFAESNLSENSFANASFRHSVFKQGSFLKKNDFLLAKMDSVHFYGIDSVENTALDSMSITMGGATGEEVKRHRQHIIKSLMTPEQSVEDGFEKLSPKDFGDSNFDFSGIKSPAKKVPGVPEIAKDQDHGQEPVSPTAADVQKKHLLVDMDGTLAKFVPVDTLEKLYEPGYFANLEPLINVLSAIKLVIKEHPEVEVSVLSSVLSDSPYAINDKNSWLDKYLPEVDKSHRYYPSCGTEKKNAIPGGISSNHYLLDDYTKNLTSWEPPAIGIKLLNGINHTNRTWQRNRISAFKNPEEIAENIIKIMDGKLVADMQIRKGVSSNKKMIVPEPERASDRFIQKKSILPLKNTPNRGFDL